jgi:hypothetical protein
MQRKQQEGECWVCVILFSQIELVSMLCRVCSLGNRGRSTPFPVGSQGDGAPCPGVLPPIFFYWFSCPFWGTWFFANGFLFLVNGLWFLTNPGHWIRVFDDVGSYMYIVL